MPAGKLAEAFVEIGVDRRGLDRGLGTSMGAIKSFAASAAAQLAGLSVVGAGLGAANWFREGILSAGSLNEALSKTEVTFGAAGGRVVGFAETMADKFGSAKGQIIDAASGFGLIFKGANIAEDASADLSIRLATAADDAASLFDSSLPEALEKIRAGLVGESEPLRAFGVMLNETAVAQEAVRLGLAKTTKELSESAKIMARASLIEKQLAVAKGDHARTQGGFNNQLKEMGGRLGNLGTQIGSAFTGPLSFAMKLVNAGIGTMATFGEMINHVVDASSRTLFPSWGADAAKAKAAADAKAADDRKADEKAKAEAARPANVRAKAEVEARKKARDEIMKDEAEAAQDRVKAMEQERRAAELVADRNRAIDVGVLRDTGRENEIVIGPGGKLAPRTPLDAERNAAEALLSRAKGALTTGLGMAGQLKGDVLGTLGRAGGLLAADTPKLRGGVTSGDDFDRALQSAGLNAESEGKATVDELKKHTDKLDQIFKALSGGARDIVARFG